jgi:hypothetical protein
MMIFRQKPTIATASLALALLVASTLSADARGGHGGLHGVGFSHGLAGHSMHGVEFAGARRFGNDDHIKAASDDRDKLLNTQIKSICYGC